MLLSDRTRTALINGNPLKSRVIPAYFWDQPFYVDPDPTAMIHTKEGKLKNIYNQIEDCLRNHPEEMVINDQDATVSYNTGWKEVMGKFLCMVPKKYMADNSYIW